MDTPSTPVPKFSYEMPEWPSKDGNSPFLLSGWRQRRSTASSSSSTDSTSFWQEPPKSLRRSICGLRLPWFPIASQHANLRNIILCIFLMISARAIFCLRGQPKSPESGAEARSAYQYIRPELPIPDKVFPDPIQWLRENSNNKYAFSGTLLRDFPLISRNKRPRAALITLVRNSELNGISQSMRQLEYRWNRKYRYPWIFFNDEPFSDEFKEATGNLTTSQCYYEIIPKEHWSLPDWIDEGRFTNSLEYLGTIGVGKGWMISYHHMCRWNSGFFYKHPRLRNFDWYWRVEPNVHYYCDIDYDIFRFMRDNDLKYGTNMVILDDARSFPSLWSRTKAFIMAHPQLIHPEADFNWLLDPNVDSNYNNCQFFSNFEIGSLNFWRGEANEKYFEWLDGSGGFYYERFGDAPVHTLSVSILLPKSQIWFFRDIGYQHDINHQCPPLSQHRCSCEPTSIDENFYKLVPLESPQRKPKDTCVRQFLGGPWLETKKDWSAAGERALGGDGYHGYTLWGNER